MSDTNFTVAFIGLPSAGKSTIINSLIGKRILESGICRTTTEYKLLDELIEDDNNNKFKVIDLPGICDSEESNTNFNKLTNEHIEKANLIIWTSDVNKAFITTHEVNEYNRIKEYIKNLNSDSGKLYYLIIMLSKCDKDISNNKIKIKKSRKSNEEISDSDEDTDINDIIVKVREKFPNEDIILFNAFGRSYNNKKSSPSFKKFVEKNCTILTKYNIKFDITKYIKDYNIRQDDEYLNNFKYKYQSFLNNQFDIDKLLNIWNNITNVDKNNFLENICNESFNTKLKIFQFIETIYDRKYITINKNIIYNKLIEYYLHILNNGLYSKSNNYMYDFNNDILINFISKSFVLLNKIQKTLLYNKLLFNYNDLKCNFRVELINKIHEKLEERTNYLSNNTFNVLFEIKKYNRYEYDFENNFNIFITSYDKFDKFDLLSYDDKFNRFYHVIKKTIQIKDYKFEYDINKQTIKEIFNNYIEHLNKMYEDKDYILLNKLEILYDIIGNNMKTIKNTSYYKFLTNEFIIPLSRLKLNSLFIEINENIWQEIYSNNHINFCKSYEIEQLIPINQYELLYYIDNDNQSIKTDSSFSTIN